MSFLINLLSHGRSIIEGANLVNVLEGDLSISPPHHCKRNEETIVNWRVFLMLSHSFFFGTCRCVYDHLFHFYVFFLSFSLFYAKLNFFFSSFHNLLKFPFLLLLLICLKSSTHKSSLIYL